MTYTPDSMTDTAILRSTGLQLQVDLLRDLWPRSLRVFSYPLSNYYQYKSRNGYARSINAYKDQLSLPFYFYTHGKPASFYVVVPEGEPDPGVLTILDQPVRPIKEAYPPSLKEHILLKLLLAYFFYQYSKREPAMRITQAGFLIAAHAQGKRLQAIEISLKSKDSRQRGWTDFCLAFQAKFMDQVSAKDIRPEYLKVDAYYEAMRREEVLYYRQLKPSKVLEQAEQGPVFRIGKGSAKYRPQVDWFSSKKEEQGQCRAYLLYLLQERFCGFVNELLGDTVLRGQTYQGFEEFRVKEYRGQDKEVKRSGYRVPKEKLRRVQDWKKANKPPKEADDEAKKAYEKACKQAERLLPTGLPYGLLPAVYVYDNRLRDLETGALLSEVPFDELLEPIRTKLHDMLMPFEVRALKKTEDLPIGSPLLVLQDVEEAAFATTSQEDESLTDTLGFLRQVGHEDPKQALYKQLPGVAKQTLSVNPHEVIKKGKGRYHINNWETYFAYNTQQAVDTATGHKLEVSVNELLLKWLLSNRQPMYCPDAIEASMPLFEEGNRGLADFCYLQNNRLLYFDEALVARVWLLTNIEERQTAQSWLQHWAGIDLWENVLKPLEKPGKSRQKDIRQDEEEEQVADIGKVPVVIHRSGAVAVIEKLTEYPLPDYAQMQEGKVSRSADKQVGLLGVWFHFGLSLYAVGTDNMGGTEQRGNPLYKLHMLGDKPLPEQAMEELARSLTVRFVRHQQYTVLPYPFDLLRLWGEV